MHIKIGELAKSVGVQLKSWVTVGGRENGHFMELVLQMTLLFVSFFPKIRIYA